MKKPYFVVVCNLPDFSICFYNVGFVSYVILVAASAGSLIFYASPRWGQSNPLVYITITGTIGSISVVGCKGLGVAIKQTLAGSSQLDNPVTWLILVTVVVCIVVQVFTNFHIQLYIYIFISSLWTPIIYDNRTNKNQFDKRTNLLTMGNKNQEYCSNHLTLFLYKFQLKHFDFICRFGVENTTNFIHGCWISV